MGALKSGPGFSRWLRTNQGVGILLAVLAAGLFLYLWNQDWFHRVQRDRFSLGFFPGLGVGAIFLCAVALIVDRSRNQISDDMGALGWPDLFWSLAFCIGSYVMFLLMEPLGLTLSAAIFLFVVISALGMRPWLTVLGIAVAISVMITAVFVLLGIRLPGGIFPALF